MSFKYGASITQRCNLIYKNEKTTSIESIGRHRKEFARLNGIAPHFVIRHNKEENEGGTAKLWKCALNTARMRRMQFCGDNACRCTLPERENRLFPVQDRRETKFIRVNGALRLRILYSRNFA